MRVLFISVHPDDETLGCGGTILKHKTKGDELNWLIFTNMSVSYGFDANQITKRAVEIKTVADFYCFKKVINLEFAATRLHDEDFNKIIVKLSIVINEIKPEVIYTVNRSDIHTDHQIASKAVMSCTKSFRYPFIKRILMYECLSETEMAYPLAENAFIPNAYSDITGYIDKKIEIMKIYESEVQQPPLPRSIENIKALALYRGSTVGVRYAEAFMLVRDIF